MSQPATDPEVFTEVTTLLPQVVAETALKGNKAVEGILDEAQRAWFILHVDLRLRYLHANNCSYRLLMERPGNAGRDSVYEFVGHWLSAFLRDPEGYKQKHQFISPEEEAPVEAD